MRVSVAPRINVYTERMATKPIRLTEHVKAAG